MDEPYLLPLHVIFPLYELYYATFVFTTLQGLHEPVVCRQHVRIATILSGSLVGDTLREQAKCAASCKTGTSVSSERRSSLEDRALGSLLQPLQFIVMDALLQFLDTSFIQPSVPQSIIVISLVSVLGILLGKLRIARISLGVTFVFFVGILVSYFGVTLEEGTLRFGMNFGLVLFIYALGLQVGPAFFPSLKKGGIRDNRDSLLLVATTLVIVFCMMLFMTLPISSWVGILSGATTNTPALAAGQSSLSGAGASNAKTLSEMALACAITYPFGVVGVIIVLYVLAPLSHKKDKSTDEEHTAYFSEYEVMNMGVVGKSLSEISKICETHFVISRLWRQGKALAPSSSTRLESGDRLLVVSDEKEVERLELFFGKKMSKDWNHPDIDWDHLDGALVSRRLVLTRKELNGVRLSTLNLRNEYGVNVTRIDRAGIELLTSSDLHLQLGDRITVVGPKDATDAVAERMGNEIKDLDTPNLLGLFLGLFLGVLVGMIPLYIPGVSVPIKLGLAGGPIIIGILMGAYGPRLHVTTYITNSASLIIRQLGLILYLACLGLSSGKGFFDILFSTQGLTWLVLGAVITLVPTAIVGILMLRRKGGDYATTCGVLCGSMANPMALEVVGSRLQGNKHNVAYATVYPLAMFVRIITAQMLIVLFI